eukprot:tig00020563_g11329.t1
MSASMADLARMLGALGGRGAPAAGNSNRSAAAEDEEVLRAHRDALRSTRNVPGGTTVAWDNAAGLGPSQQAQDSFGSETSLSKCTPISLEELQLNQVHKRRFLCGRLAEEPVLLKGVYQVLAKPDGAGPLVRIAFYNAERAAKRECGGWQKAFAAGREICIRNPFFKIAMDGTRLVRVESPADVVFVAPGAASSAGMPPPAPAAAKPAAAAAAGHGGKSRPRKTKSEVAAEEAEASAAKTAVEAARAAGASAEELNAKGNDAFKAGRNAEAEVWYGAAMKADPGAAKYPSNRAAVRLKLLKHAEAYADARAANKLDPKWAKPVVRMATALYEQESYEEAIRLYEKAQKLEDEAGSSESRAAIEDGISCCRREIAAKEIRLPTTERTMQNVAQSVLKEQMSKLQSNPKDIAKLFESATPDALKLFQNQTSTLSICHEAHMCRDGTHGRKKDMRRASELYLQAAKKGNTEAMYNLAKHYEENESNFAEAITWLNKAASQPVWIFQNQLPNVGVAEAFNMLGCMNRDGIGMKPDPEAAARWFRKAAESGTKGPGHMCGLNNLGYCYDNGIGVSKDSAEAARWYRKGAENGYAVSQYNLGELFEHGRGVPVDLSQARTWYEKAAKQDLPMAMIALARLSASPADALKARIDAANKGMPEEMYNLGLAYLRGRDGARKSVKEARAWFQKSAEAGFELGMCELGLLLVGALSSLSKKEKEEVSDPKRGANWVLKAAEKGNPRACYAYAKLLATGTGVEKDLAKAKQWMKNAAKRGFKDAERALKSGDLDRMAALEVDEREMAQKLNFDLETGTFKDGPTPLLDEIEDPEQRENMQAALAAIKQLGTLAKKPAPEPEYEKIAVPDFGSGGVRGYDMASLQKYASSPTAQRLMDARRHFDASMNLLRQGHFPAAIRALAECYKREEIVAQFPDFVVPMFMTAVEAILEENPNDVDALFVNAAMLMGSRSAEESANFATKCITLDPTQAGFYRLRGAMRSFAKQYDKAIRDFDKALEIMANAADPYRYDLLYLRATALFLSEGYGPRCEGKARQALEEYIREAPPDERKVAEAHYQLCLRLLHELRDFDAAKATFERAKEAERRRLPVFPPIDADWPHKILARQAIELMERAPRAFRRDREESVSCAACGAEGPSLKECGRCHAVSYCNADCQRAHWKQHKKACKAAPAE